MRAAHVWRGIAAAVIVHNVTAREGDTLSECMDGWIARHPVLWRAVIVAVAVHVGNVVPPRLDPVHWLFVAARHRDRMTVRKWLGKR